MFRKKSHIFIFMTCLFITAHRVSADPTSTTLPDNRDPCAAFVEGGSYVSQTIIMNIENREVTLHVPEIFFEDSWDKRQGFTDTSQLFRVEIGTFTPVSREETANRNKRGIWNWMTFLIGDYIPLEDLASYYIGKDISSLDSDQILPDLPKNIGPFDLLYFDHHGDNYQDVFASIDSNGLLSSMITCDNQINATYPGCTQWFRAAGVDVQLRYRRSELSNWNGIQKDVTAFLNCAIITR